jgi:ATP-dependent Clp protease adaptor protein ClpS
MAIKHSSTLLLEKLPDKIKPPKLYNVLLFNDDFTTMEFVIEVLQKFFTIEHERAVKTMLKVHKDGSAICGIYPKDIAETKASQVTSFAKQHQHPLRCETEES